MADVTSPSATRMQRLLAMVPWIASRDGPRLTEVQERFGITAEELAADLDVMWLVGLPPYTPDALVDVVQEGDRVWIHFGDVFDAPQRLTPEQGLALLTAGASVLALPGAPTDDALARGVAKLGAVLGLDTRQALDVDLGAALGEVVRMLRTAVADQHRVHLSYYSHGRDAATERDVDPYLLHAEAGNLYLLGYCYLAQAERRFRVDRIATVTALDDRFDRPAEVGPSGIFQPDPDDPRVVLDLAPEAAWVVDIHPVEQVEAVADGAMRVTLAITGQAWFERLLVELGPHVVVVDAPPELAEAGRRAAARILDRYR